MGGEGAMMHMIHTLRNNKSMLNKRKERRLNNWSSTGEKLEFENTATQANLLQIRLKLQKERKQKLIKIIVTFGIFMILFIAVVAYFF
ncbi:hypothetical protein OS188_08425 [Xanthomarina sp. F1114]|uniref:hypothetical protein n=1 Tax=Xanthomarina sp. F1114 TaxID=2996019 RepID=UPI00225E51FD|nr:hypothetical protein [Xanthomarina sp. F1114]MCX7547977.1 hypothetical protein [Xanthomarina sp. F1114]